MWFLSSTDRRIESFHSQSIESVCGSSDCVGWGSGGSIWDFWAVEEPPGSGGGGGWVEGVEREIMYLGYCLKKVSAAREGIDANHSQLLNLGTNAITSTASCGFILDAFTPTTIAEALTIQPETLLAPVTTSSIVVVSEATVLSAANEASLASPIAHSNVLFAESPDHVSVSSQQDVHTAIVPNPTLVHPSSDQSTDSSKSNTLSGQKRKRSTAHLSSDADDEFSSENSESKKLLTTQFNSLEVTQQTTLDILVQDALNTSTSLPAEVPTMGNSSPTTSSLGLRQTVPQQSPNSQ
ncbi:hypothetical protein COLO4_07515 [Corchorus olitorius]|uniref:Uncharacterized protein n=1 Tax=Corchorus olitorius TaxID=93759 RepID=A0A1R3KJH4_9ROSI|nr:hypothetical protein COLO4_07515 [Corchorus olitorius]